MAAAMELETILIKTQVKMAQSMGRAQARGSSPENGCCGIEQHNVNAARTSRSYSGVCRPAKKERSDSPANYIRLAKLCNSIVCLAGARVIRWNCQALINAQIEYAFAQPEGRPCLKYGNASTQEGRGR